MLPHTYYRRRFFDGRQHVFHSYGAGRVVCDNADVLVLDWSVGAPQRITDGVGWSIDAPRSQLFHPEAMRAFGRSWWWRSRPMNVMTAYDPQGQIVIQRIDFASKAMTLGNCMYQTDLYLDCFVAADGITHLVEDQDEVEEAENVGLLSTAQRRMIEAELTIVQAKLVAGTWFDWLEVQAGAPFNHHLLTHARSYDGYWQTGIGYWPEDD